MQGQNVEADLNRARGPGSLGFRTVGVARSLGELRSCILAHVWGPPPVQFPDGEMRHRDVNLLKVTQLRVLMPA